MGCAAAKQIEEQPNGGCVRNDLRTEREAAKAMRQHMKPNVGDIFASKENRMANQMTNITSLMGDPRMQAQQAKMLSSMLSGMPGLMPMGGVNPQMQAFAVNGAASEPVVIQGTAIPPGADASATDVTARLLKLKTLLDAGAISQSEYDAKKSELLAEL